MKFNSLSLFYHMNEKQMQMTSVVLFFFHGRWGMIMMNFLILT